jgi:iron complex outermembrane recepter protein
MQSRQNYPLISRFLFILISILTISEKVSAQISGEVASVSALKKLSLEELLDMEVTSVSKRPERLSEVASAIQVITNEDIVRSAATTLPEALRLASNLQVAQLSSQHFIISARGFNSTFSNKLLVMINGRTVYSPLFAGVFWDAQNVVLEDIDRIEVISGPGGSLWGANAVNGVINIITKEAKETQGLLASVSAGTFLKDLFQARYGGSIGDKISYGIYGMHLDRNPTEKPDGEKNNDQWKLSQTGFKIDWKPTEKNDVSILGNIYIGENQLNDSTKSTIDGQNALAKWTHVFSGKSDMLIQAYFDRTWRHDVVSTFNDELTTYDIEFQHHQQAGSRNNILWGGGYRFMRDKTQNSTLFVGLLPTDRDMDLFSGFIQDEIDIVHDHLKLTAGTKFQHNEFSGFEVQPSARLAWNFKTRHTLWAAVSKAVRAPSRIDVDYHIPAFPVPPDQASIAGGPNFVSEKVKAYELGYRVQPTLSLSVSAAVFYNVYDDLFSVEPRPGTLTYEIQNGSKGKSHGAELNWNYQLLRGWRLRGGYTYFQKTLKNKPGNVTDPSAQANLGSDAKNQFLLQSIANLPGNLQLDVTFRYVDVLPKTQFNPEVPAYTTADARLAWKYKTALLSINGQNLMQHEHAEFAGNRIHRSYYVKVILRLWESPADY